MRLMSLFLRSLLLALVLAQPACAEDKKSSPEAAIRKSLTAQFPNHKVGEIRKSPLAGIYEVSIGSEVVYSDAQGRYVLFGDLMDLSTRTNLSDMRKNEAFKEVFDQLPLNAAIKVVRGKGERRLAVFTDPDCPFCKQLDRVGLRNIDNVTIYYFLLPLDQLHPDARRKSANVWCAPDRAKAWYALMYDDQEAPAATCDVPFDQVAEWAEKLQFRGTPGLFFENGQRVPGAISPENIEKLLTEARTRK